MNGERKKGQMMTTNGVLAAIVRFGLAALVACSQSNQGRTAQDAQDEAVRSVVGAALDPSNKLGVTASDLRSKRNPKGDGTFVYVPRTDYSGVTRNLVWLVLDGKAFALNGPSKTATPSVSFPRDADEAAWTRTGLNKYSATEAINLVWGENR